MTVPPPPPPPPPRVPPPVPVSDQTIPVRLQKNSTPPPNAVPPNPYPQPPASRRRRTTLIIACAVALVVVVALGAFFGITHLRDTGADSAGGDSYEAVGSGGGGSDTSDSVVTRCESPPTFTPTDIVTDSDALAVTMKITATCASGDVLSSNRTRLSVSTSGSNVASGYFNFSTTPIFVPRTDSSGPEYVEHVFRFPIGAFWQVPTSLPSSTKFVVAYEPVGATGTESGEFMNSSNSFDATSPAAPATGDAEQASYDALRTIAAADKPVILSQLGEKWVPQISSKRLGLVAEGITWNNTEMLREHLELRLRYPNVKLLWSGEWSVFSSKDFWVTVAGVAHSDPADANRWCDSNSLSADHCFAKLISATHPAEGSTVSR